MTCFLTKASLYQSESFHPLDCSSTNPIGVLDNSDCSLVATCRYLPLPDRLLILCTPLFFLIIIAVSPVQFARDCPPQTVSAPGWWFKYERGQFTVFRAIPVFKGSALSTSLRLPVCPGALELQPKTQHVEQSLHIVCHYSTSVDAHLYYI